MVQIKDLGAKAGVVLNPGTSLDTIEYVLDIVDLILIMSGTPLRPGFWEHLLRFWEVQRNW